MQTIAPRGRPKRNAEFDSLVSGLPNEMRKRPVYLHGIGVFRGQRGDTAWVKISLPSGGTYKGKTYAPGAAIEIKVGRLASFTWDQLRAKHTELQGKADRGEPLEEAPCVKFDEWAADWLQRAKGRVKGYETIEVHVRCHLNPEFGSKPINKINGQDINRWASKQGALCAPATVKRQHNTLRAILNDALRSGLIETNPCQLAEPVRGGPGRMRFLEMSELVSLLAIAETVADWLPDFILWSVHSGMRKGETRAMRWADTKHIEDRTIIHIPTSKTGQPRFITCTKTMDDILERQKARGIAGDNRVFPLSPMTLRRKWEKARAAAGLPDVTIHDLRRTHSTFAVAAGVDLRTLADRLGHADLTMLQKHYAAVVGAKAIEAADTIQKAFERQRGRVS